MRRFKAVIFTLMFIVGLTAPMTPVYAATNLFGDTCQGVKDSAVCQQASKQDSTKNPVINALRVVANGFALAAGVGAVIMIIISGFKFVTGGGSFTGQRSGDPNAIKSARATLVASIVGLLVVIFAWVVIRLITDRVLQ